MSTLKLRYVALGDSTGAGVGCPRGEGYVEHLFQRLRAVREGVGLLNLCQPGATSARARWEQLSRAQRAKPHLFTVGLGGNDLWRGVSPEELETHLEAVVAPLVGAGAVGVACNIPDLSLAPIARQVPPSMYAGRFAGMNAAIARVAGRHGLALVDLFSASQSVLPRHPEYFSADGFHPSPAGYRFWAGEMWGSVLAMADRALAS